METAGIITNESSMDGWSGTVDTMDYVQIMTTGNAVDFGDLSLARWAGGSGISNAHGGL